MNELLKELGIDESLSGTDLAYELRMRLKDLHRKHFAANSEKTRRELSELIEKAEDLLEQLENSDRMEISSGTATGMGARNDGAKTGLVEYVERPEPETQKNGVKTKPEDAENGLSPKKDREDFNADEAYDEYVAAGHVSWQRQREQYRELSLRAEQGCEAAMNLLGYMANERKEVSETVRASRYFMEAGRMGNGTSLTNLFILHEKGVALPRDGKKMRDCLDEALALKNYRAYYLMAEACRDGDRELGVSKDTAMAADHYRKCIHAIDDRIRSGKMKKKPNYYNTVILQGAICRKQFSEEYTVDEMIGDLKLLLEDETADWRDKACKAVVDAYAGDKNYAQAVQWALKIDQDRLRLETLFELYDMMAGTELGDKLVQMLQSMTGDENHSTYVRGTICGWYAKTFEPGLDDVTYFCYIYRAAKFLGKSEYTVKKDQMIRERMMGSSIDSFDYTKRVAEHGCMEIYRYLAEKYRDGRGCVRDYSKAAECYTLAEMNRDAEQMKAFVRMEQSYLRAVELLETDNFEQALETIRLVSDQGLPAAKYKMGMLHEKGYRIRQSDKKAVAFYKEAAGQYDRQAIRRLVDIYRNGELGESKNASLAQKYETLLK